jgi:uncharacterized repeat protein (TIGR03803 family)
MAGTQPIRIPNYRVKALSAVIVFALGAGVAQQAQAQTYTLSVLYAFSNSSDGGFPHGVVLDSQGNVYGAAQYGGYFSCGPRAFQSCGTVFKLDQAGHETVLHDFSAAHGDGMDPLEGVIMDSQGNLYGSTVAGGDLTCTQPGPFSNVNGCGMVFKLDPSGHESVLHTFTGLSGGGDGAAPYGRLVQDASGNLYGTTYSGGTGSSACTSNGQQGCGTVFKLDPSGHETVLYRFTGGNSDGQNPEAALVLDAHGNLYGTTCFGGSFGFGTVFKLDPSGHETVLHSFYGVNEGMNNGDGANPIGTLVFDAQGNLYGTTVAGGDDTVGLACFGLSYGCGTVFEISPSGHRTVLYRFSGANGDGAFAFGNLVLDATGNMYGTTGYGGEGFGIAFKLDPSGNETVIHTFDAEEGGDPRDLVSDAQGNLYGTAEQYGAHQFGTVYKLSPPGQ